MSYYPSFEEILQRPDVTRLLEVKRSLRSIIPNIFYFCVTVVVVYFLNYFFYDVRPSENIPILRHISVRWLAIVPVLFLAEIVRRYHDDLYIFDLHRLTHLEGRLSLSYKVPVITYIDVRAISVTQDIFGRIFDYGTVSIGTAAKDGDELVMSGVRDPESLGKLVDEFRNYSKQIATEGVAAAGAAAEPTGSLASSD
jgi:membrane protein YdbS with pleckstrin-like domain